MSEAAVVKMVGEGAAVLVRRALAASAWIPTRPARWIAFWRSMTRACWTGRGLYPGMVETLEQPPPLAGSPY